MNSDGCTGVPEFYRDCCLEHDIAYQTGRDIHGRVLTRAKADARFRRCIQRDSRLGYFSPMALWRWAGVRLFGARHWKGNS